MTAIKSFHACFQNHRQAALALLTAAVNGSLPMTHKEAGFLGNICVADVLTERQGQWLAALLDRAYPASPETGAAA